MCEEESEGKAVVPENTLLPPPQLVKPVVGDADELVDGWPRWLVNNVPPEMLAGLIPKSADSYEKLDKVFYLLGVFRITSCSANNGQTFSYMICYFTEYLKTFIIYENFDRIYEIQINMVIKFQLYQLPSSCHLCRNAN